MAIAAARQKHGMVQEDLAATLGVRQATISRWERGVVAPSKGHQSELARLLGIEYPA